ncbi:MULTISPECIES: hypothetical protein [unclassified Luteimonas]
MTTVPLRTWFAFATLALLLLVATMAWHLPMMLWDHIDLVPMYEAWRDGTLASSAFWRIHDGSHLHVSGYAVLLLTTAASGGQPWLDCLASVCLLVLQAWILMRIAGAAPVGRIGGIWLLALLWLALNPGHLVNLQWGWQVAVFISTLGAVATIALLTRPGLSAIGNLLAVLLASLGVLGFSTTLAVFPIALGLLALHPGLSRAQRVLFALPWLLAGGALLGWVWAGRGAAAGAPGLGTLLMYVLNYLGAGVSRLATTAAPVWAAVALATAVWAAARRWQPALLPWLALMLFGIGCALLTALGRAAEYGAEHAFVTRYVSFSSLFWFGWIGLMLVAWRDVQPAWRRWVRPLLSVLLVFLLGNGIHMAKQARELHVRAEGYAAHIRASWPDVDAGVMEAAYGWRAEAAHGYLGVLRARGFAPFDRASQPAGTGVGSGQDEAGRAQ